MTSETPATSPQQQPTTYIPPEPAFGFSAYAEQINGRFAMVGFLALVILEFFTRQDIFTWLGLR